MPVIRGQVGGAHGPGGLSLAKTRESSRRRPSGVSSSRTGAGRSGFTGVEVADSVRSVTTRTCDARFRKPTLTPFRKCPWAGSLRMEVTRVMRSGGVLGAALFCVRTGRRAGWSNS
jgi:hypothetical protein